MSDVILGNKIVGDANRDAIHIAIAPVTAGENLKVGQHIGFISDNTELVGYCSNPIGIVDPFLSKPVKTGEKFWMCLYPKTITSLRHDWVHPAFNGEKVGNYESRRWIEEYASGIPLSYEQIMGGAAEYLRSGEYLCFGGLLEGISVDGEFWDHYEKVTNTQVDDRNRGSFFTCSC